MANGTEQNVKLTPTEKAISHGVACIGVGAAGAAKEGTIALFDILLEMLGADNKAGSFANSPKKIAHAASEACASGEQIIDKHPGMVKSAEEAAKNAVEIGWDLLKKLANSASEAANSASNTVPNCTPGQTGCAR